MGLGMEWALVKPDSITTKYSGKKGQWVPHTHILTHTMVSVHTHTHQVTGCKGSHL